MHGTPCLALQELPGRTASHVQVLSLHTQKEGNIEPRGSGQVVSCTHRETHPVRTRGVYVPRDVPFCKLQEVLQIATLH
eukprot:scaffold268218_cov21-Tisochrysis_lutea.AAC.1